MKQSDRQKFADLMGGIYAIYRAELSEVVLETWWQLFKSYDLDAVDHALKLHVLNPDTGQFIPKPADIVRMAGGTTKDSAILAWSKVNDGIRRIGNYSSIVFDDPIIHRVIQDMGGWPTVCSTTEKEYPFLQRRFEEAYRAYKVRGEVPVHPSRLIGTIEAQNGFMGYTIGKDYPDPVKLIGEPNACKLISSGAMLPKPLALPERVT